ncbi:UDP-2,4-diacetamido-2,4,6-trideoxy-beta-L-altropyranose hydrolase [Eikenella sp. S3360]|uniref:UDP-2,4-diacetamido-2,4, 6-trideoxy-beta-L-altropyranose hydrolase n=1 Tax=Eikenella glucosivorans TaxID=2766967 RepID=A0ABS0NC17_9NEIS|nr:UDP-2,4-diacetamido-2,4,6-trideoxy-beta-L-altropyranose hydrolase [Eikenella glucosivorans]MBH5329873.1 UDP-2,4-diacetamido-2,4,6-trideoxy-beta-L-altropyranose hydrolase [Eikenella glucosivorans]
MKFLIRADASLQIGSGHIMRCLTLAHELSRRGHEVRFICRALPGHLGATIERAGFDLVLLPAPPQAGRLPENRDAPEQNAATHPQPAHAHWLPVSQAQDATDCLPHIRAFAPDWIICDHYALSAEWEQAARAAAGSRLMVIDDLVDRPHVADLLLDQNLDRTPADYAGLVPAACRLLTGTRYALLRPEFVQWREKSLERRAARAGKGCLQNILLNLGGVDKDNHTLAVLQAFSGSLPPDCRVTVVMGRTAPHTAAVQAFANSAPYPCRVLVGADNMAELMAEADLAIGAAGSTSWERCCLGLPTIMLVLAANQRGVAEALQQAGAAQCADMADLPADLRRLLAEPPAAWAEQGRRAAALCDGHGTRRVANNLADFVPAVLRAARSEDCRRLFEWRNHPDIRRFMFDSAEIAWDGHQAWFARQLANPDFTMLLYETGGAAQGYACFKHLGNGIGEWGFYLAPDCPRGQGHGSILGRLALQYAFSRLKMREIYGQVLPHNSASLALHRRLHFREADKEAGQAQLFVLPAEEFLY